MQTTFCQHCNATISTQSRFCGSCGTKVTFAKVEREKKSLRLVIIFYLLYLLYAIVSYVISAESFELGTELAMELIFIGLTVAFALFDYKNIIRLYTIKSLHFRNILFSVLFPIASALVVYYVYDWINWNLFETTDNVFYMYSHYSNTLVWVLFFYTVLPPIFEELAFRGFLFNQLQQLFTPWVTICATAFIFALVHFSFVSLLWIFPFGLLLGYMRWRYKTLWLGMIIHFIHNFLVVMLDYYYYEDIFELTF